MLPRKKRGHGGGSSPESSRLSATVGFGVGLRHTITNSARNRAMTEAIYAAQEHQRPNGLAREESTTPTACPADAT